MSKEQDEAESLSDHQRRLDEREGVGFCDIPQKYVALVCDEMGQTEIVEKDINTLQVGNPQQETDTQKRKRGRPRKEQNAQPSKPPQEAREEAKTNQTPPQGKKCTGSPARGKTGDTGTQKRKRGRPRKQGWQPGF